MVPETESVVSSKSTALAAWREGAAKQAILDFVARTCEGADDDKREFDYTSGAEQALEQAGKDGWTVVSVKKDWPTVF